MEIYFKDLRENNAGVFYANLKSRTLLTLKRVQGEDISDERFKIYDDFFYRQLLPKNYFGAEGFGVKYKKEFEEMCILMNQFSPGCNPKEMTTLEWFQHIERMKKK